MLLHSVTPPPYDWILIIAFYAAVRYVTAYYFQCFNCGPRDHSDRNGFVNKMLPSVANAYDQLYSRSRVVRYEVIKSQVNERAAKGAISIAERVRDEITRLV